MENNTFKVQDVYIGKVVSIDKTTHEIEVYIPKLMPTLSYGFSDTVYNVDLQSEVLKTNTLLCKPIDFKDRVPDVGSLVSVNFLDGDIKKVYWREFDPFGTNKYIEFEKTGNDKTLDDFANMIDISGNSLLPKETNMKLGSKEKPFAEIFGKIKTEYIIGLDEKLKEIDLSSLSEQIAQANENNVDANELITPSEIPKLVTYDAKGLVTGGYDITTLKEVSIVNTAIGNSPYTVNAIAGTTANLATFSVNNVEKFSIGSAGNVSLHSFLLENSPGYITWSTDNETMEIPMGNGVIQQVGEELYYPLVKNMTGSTIPNGTPVAAVGSDGIYTLITPMIADGSIDPVLYMGLTTETISNGNTGRVTYFGRVKDLDTSSYAFGTLLWVSSTTPGELVDEKPYSPDLTIDAGMVIKSDASEGRIFVRHQRYSVASDVSYDNTDSNLIASNIQAAVDELYSTKADSSALSSNITVYQTDTLSDITGYYRMVDSTLDPDYDIVAVDIPSGTITGLGDHIADFVADPSLFTGDPGIINVTIIGNIRKISGNTNWYAEFYFEIYHRDNLGTETLVATSNTTGPVNTDLGAYGQFTATAILNNGTWLPTDRLVMKWYGNLLSGTAPEYEFQIGGISPTRVLIPVPVSVIPSDVASDILTDTTNFDKILSDTDINVQKALETLDEHKHPSSDVTDNNRTMEDIVSWFDNVMSAGRMWGGRITSNGDGTISVAAGGGLIKGNSSTPESYAPPSINTEQGSRTSYVSWGEVASLTLVDDAYNFIYYDGSEDIITSTTDITAIDYTQDFTVGRTYRIGNEVFIRWCGMNIWNFMRRVQAHGEEIERLAVKKGTMILGSSGLNLSHNGGVIWAEGLVRFTIDAWDSAGSDTFTYWYRDGVGGWVRLIGQSVIDNIHYDDGSGTLANLINNRYGVHWVFSDHTGGVHIIYGRGNYTLNEAGASGVPGDIPGLVSAYGTILGRVIVQQGDSTLTDLQSALTTTFSSVGVSLHDELGNRTLPDSHPGTAISYDNTLSGMIASTMQAAIDELDARVDLNDAKTTNTITDLSLGTITATNVPILSSDGNDIPTLPAATELLAGIVINGSQTFGGDKTFGGTVTILGDFYVQGDNFISNTGTVTTEDDVILLRTGSSSPITSPAGLVINSYNGTDHGGMVIDAAGEMRIGDLGLDASGKVNDTSNSQPVMTRDETVNLSDMDIMVWDSANYKSIGKTITELGLALANGGTFNEITVTNDDIASSPLTINAILGTTSHLQQWEIDGVYKAFMQSDGMLGTSGIKNISTEDNSQILLETIGTYISRNKADANAALIVNLENASSTGQVQKWQFLGVDVAKIEPYGTMRAQAFSDISNSAFYLDPANTSTSLNVAGNVYTAANKGYYSGDKLMLLSDGTDNFIRTGANYLYLQNSSGTNRGWLSSVGDLAVAKVVDFANTAYFLDPADTGTSLNVAGHIKTAGNIHTGGPLYFWPDATGAYIDNSGTNSTGLSLVTRNNNDILLSTGTGEVKASNSLNVNDYMFMDYAGPHYGYDFKFPATGSVARGYHLSLNNDTKIGGIGAWVVDNVLQRIYIGGSYSTSPINILPNGNVGFNTTDPQQPLHVNGDGRISSLLLGTSDVSNNPDTTLHLKGDGEQAIRIEDSTGLNLAYDLKVNASTRKLSLYDVTNDNIIFSTSDDGHMGIAGDSHASYPLYVHGRLGATDYVAATKFVDISNGAFYLDPADTGTSLNIAGDINLSTGKALRWVNGNAEIRESVYDMIFKNWDGVDSLDETLRIKSDGDVNVTKGNMKILEDKEYKLGDAAAIKYSSTSKSVKITFA